MPKVYHIHKVFFNLNIPIKLANHIIRNRNQKDMTVHITIKLFATLNRFTPGSSDCYSISPGTTVRSLLKQLGVPEDDARLIFINGTKGNLNSTLEGGERVGIFPPVGGG